jgi:hypothetical protein
LLGRLWEFLASTSGSPPMRVEPVCIFARAEVQR